MQSRFYKWPCNQLHYVQEKWAWFEPVRLASAALATPLDQCNCNMGDHEDDSGKKAYIRVQFSKDIVGVTEKKLEHLLFCIHKVQWEGGTCRVRLREISYWSGTNNTAVLHAGVSLPVVK